MKKKTNESKGWIMCLVWDFFTSPHLKRITIWLDCHIRDISRFLLINCCSCFSLFNFWICILSYNLYLSLGICFQYVTISCIYICYFNDKLCVAYSLSSVPLFLSLLYGIRAFNCCCSLLQPPVPWQQPIIPTLYLLFKTQMNQTHLSYPSISLPKHHSNSPQPITSPGNFNSTLSLSIMTS